MILGSPGPSPLTLSSHKGHFGPSKDGRESLALDTSHIVSAKEYHCPSGDGRESSGPFRIPHCRPTKDIISLLAMIGCWGPYLHQTLLHRVGHHGPTVVVIAGISGSLPLFWEGHRSPSSDRRESWALSASHIVVL
jgi:hypothetical protein